ncbi:hypothetical protein EDD15DRAFT_2198251 [Pisolithus albus]|nr:hypothetical protein EDD15DRAFT_2198251 [Pisolithus albus]
MLNFEHFCSLFGSDFHPDSSSGTCCSHSLPLAVSKKYAIYCHVATPANTIERDGVLWSRPTGQKLPRKKSLLTSEQKSLCSRLMEEYVAVNVSVLHYGKGPLNPLDDMTFYSKQQPDVWTPSTPLDSPSPPPPTSSQKPSTSSLSEHCPSPGVHVSTNTDPPPAPSPDVGGEPVVHCPSTRLTSNSTGTGQRGRTFGRNPSFSDNASMTIPPNFRDMSPSRKPRSKRAKEGEEHSFTAYTYFLHVVPNY